MESNLPCSQQIVEEGEEQETLSSPRSTTSSKNSSTRSFPKSSENQGKIKNTGGCNNAMLSEFLGDPVERSPNSGHQLSSETLHQLVKTLRLKGGRSTTIALSDADAESCPACEAAKLRKDISLSEAKGKKERRLSKEMSSKCDLHAELEETLKKEKSKRKSSQKLEEIPAKESSPMGRRKRSRASTDSTASSSNALARTGSSRTGSRAGSTTRGTAESRSGSRAGSRPGSRTRIASTSSAATRGGTRAGTRAGSRPGSATGVRRAPAPQRRSSTARASKGKIARGSKASLSRSSKSSIKSAASLGKAGRKGGKSKAGKSSADLETEIQSSSSRKFWKRSRSQSIDSQDKGANKQVAPYRKKGVKKSTSRTSSRTSMVKFDQPGPSGIRGRPKKKQKQVNPDDASFFARWGVDPTDAYKLSMLLLFYNVFSYLR